jgi:histone acetyltransferase (RNA polymerase elongator complex component)
MDVEEIAAALDKVLPDQGDGEIAFYGGSFTMLREAQQEAYLDAACQFVSQGRVQGIRVSTRADALEEPALQLLKTYKVSTVEIGCQSFDDQVLVQAERGHSAEENRRAVSSCLAAGLQVGVQLMPGLPGGSPGEAVASVEETIKLKPDFVRIYPAVVIEGTGLADLWRSGSYMPWSLDEAVEVCADILFRCRNAGVPVIRMGLQNDEQLERNLLAGPYHPAFGQLVRSRLWRRALSELTSEEGKVSLNPVDFSDALGHGGENRKWFMQQDRPLLLKTDQTVMPGSIRTVVRELPIQVLMSGNNNG